ncbi:hypothetical protein [Roseomonas sp. HF4]|uniref:hypothetical protein n=1 Tax=Roseomonas sp. HF4 TaxID=2562313 RepID=UPI001484F91E|nr:hypothetical protein [Roseomonas sp. HF4]
MHVMTSTTPPAGLRDLFAEAAEHRRKGDLAAACYLENLAAIALRGSLAAEARREVRHG